MLSFLLTRRSGLKSPRDLNIWLISLPVWSTDNSCSNTFPWMYTSFGRVNTFGKPSAKDYHQLTIPVSKCPRKRVLKIAAYSAECEGFKVRISKCTVKLFLKIYKKAIFVNCDTFFAWILHIFAWWFCFWGFFLGGGCWFCLSLTWNTHF